MDVEGFHWDPLTVSPEWSFALCAAGSWLGQTPHTMHSAKDSDLPSLGAWKRTLGQVTGLLLFRLTQTKGIQEYERISKHWGQSSSTSEGT